MIQLSTLNQTVSQAETIALTAIIDTALCVGAGGSSGSLADKPILKTADGHLVIPASQLKGRLRHECEKLTRALGWPTCVSPVAQTMCPQRVGLPEADFRIAPYRVPPLRPEEIEAQVSNDSYRHHCLICQLFGNPALPARLQFRDLVCTTPPEDIPEVLRPGVTLNRRRRTAEDRKLYFLETSPANTALEFTGGIDLAPDIPTFAKALILAGLKHIHALGGSKSSGLGWLRWQSSAFEQPDIDDTVWTFLANSPAATQSPQEESHAAS